MNLKDRCAIVGHGYTAQGKAILTALILGC